jgi:hypothetical protein
MREFMDQNGFIFTFDGVLALIPLFLVIIIISNLPASSDSTLQVTNFQDAQDYLDILASTEINSRSLMDSMVQALQTDGDSGVEEAGSLAKPVLDNLTADKSYQLLETSQLDCAIIISKGNLDSSPAVASATRNWGNYTFILYVGQ